MRAAKLELLRPAAGVVVDAQDLHLVVYSIGDDARRCGDDEFARAGHAARVAELSASEVARSVLR
jgi:hypothetical protein